jgi:hypothetical protein
MYSHICVRSIVQVSRRIATQQMVSSLASCSGLLRKLSTLAKTSRILRSQTCLHCPTSSQCRVLVNPKHSRLHPRDWRNRTISILSLQWIPKPGNISLGCGQVVVGAIGKRAWGRRKSAQGVLVMESDKNTQERLTGTPSLIRPHAMDVMRGVDRQVSRVV